MTIKLLHGDCREVLGTLEPESVHCCVTSPPYFGLRDYGVAGQIGLEETPDAYVAELVSVFREVKRALRNDGTVWLNLGDSYAGGGNYRGISSEATLSAKQRSNGGARGVSQLLGAKNTPGVKAKDLIGIPWLVAFALRADGWYLRSDIIWHKPNPMPESVRDRPTSAHEHVFLLSKAPAYFYDGDAVREPYNPDTIDRYRYEFQGTAPNCRLPGGDVGRRERERGCRPPNELGRNIRNVWTITPQPFPEAHFATFPPELAERCIKAGCPVGGTVLDPFGGSGTVGLVARNLNRNAILIELNPEYVEMARKRAAPGPLFAGEVAS